PLQQLEAVDAGHHQVHQDHRVVVVRQLVVRDVSVGGAVDGEAFFRKESGEKSAQSLIVNDHQDGWIDSGSVGSGHAWTAAGQHTPVWKELPPDFATASE